jgi:hypothetical protein
MAEREIYKGIEFVRISKLPKDQSERIYASFPKDKIIKILQDEVLLRDCIQYHEYLEWVRKDYVVHLNSGFGKSESISANSFNLALK